ncbi:MAG: hypothetical protein ACERJ1_07275 [Halodesulfovibrio sp.]|uniref:hypothetical protein n=1 Tax=Halodesulfovibrio sp. TaxID=1912772 RepID=UPI00359D51C0
MLELVLKFMQKNDVEVPFCYEERRLGDIAAFGVNPEKVSRELNWTAQLTIEDLVINSWEAHKLNKESTLQHSA